MSPLRFIFVGPNGIRAGWRLLNIHCAHVAAGVSGAVGGQTFSGAQGGCESQHTGRRERPLGGHRIANIRFAADPFRGMADVKH